MKVKTPCDKCGEEVEREDWVIKYVHKKGQRITCVGCKMNEQKEYTPIHRLTYKRHC